MSKPLTKQELHNLAMNLVDKDAKVLYAGVGLGNTEDENSPIYLNEDYLIEYNGIQIIETNLN